MWYLSNNELKFPAIVKLGKIKVSYTYIIIIRQILHVITVRYPFSLHSNQLGKTSARSLECLLKERRHLKTLKLICYSYKLMYNL